MMEFSIAMPWVNRHRPYIALHCKHWGWALGRGRHRQVFVVMFMWGIRFTESYAHKAWYPEILWPKS